MNKNLIYKTILPFYVFLKKMQWKFKFQKNMVTDNLSIKWTDINYNRIALTNYILSTFDNPIYLEIGCFDNELFDSVPIANKIGVDPFRGGNIKKTSDDFFLDNKIIFDYAFIDGLHTFEQVTKDVINTLNATKAGSWIGIHDLIPLNWIEEHVPGYPEHHWTGDVWKVIYFIKGLKGIEFNIVLIDHGVGLIKKTSDTIFFPNFPYHLQKLTYNDFIKDYNNLPIISWDDAVKWIKNK